MRIKALTLWEPWASLMAHGKKQYETRSWPTNYRGPIAIHAAKRWQDDQGILFYRQPFKTILPEIGITGRSHFNFGCILAVGVLKQVYRAELLLPFLQKELNILEIEFGNFSDGRYAWEFESVRLLPQPLKVTGKQGLWNWQVPRHLESYMAPYFL